MTDPNAPPVDPNQAQAGTNRVVGGATSATIDQANQAMRVMPWYQDLLHSWGMSTDAGQAPTLNSAQQKQVMRSAQAHGFQVDEGNLHVDEHGNFHNNGHALRNTLIVAGLAAATIATMGAAGVFSGAAAGALGAGEGAAAAGAGVAGAGGAIGAGTLAGIEGGAAGLTGAGAAGLGAATAVPALTGAGVAGGVAGAAGAAGTAGSILPTAGTVAGATSSILPSMTGGTGGMPYDPYANPGGTGPNGTISGSGLGGPSIPSQAGQYGRAVAPVLGRAAGANAEGQQQNFTNTAGLAEAALSEPGTHLSNILKANAAAAGPVKAHWGGPGSGARGEIPYYTGGKYAPLSPELQSQLQPFEQTEMQKLLHPTLDPKNNPNLQPNGSNSPWDKILGGGAMAASILGSGGKF